MNALLRRVHLPSGVCSLWRALLMVSFLFVVSVVTRANTVLDIENELILDVRLDGRALARDILGYQVGEDIYVSLEEFLEVLRFPISVDAKNGVASGWFIEESREFYLDLNVLEVVSGTNKHTVYPNYVVTFQDYMYVSITALELWFPLEIQSLIRELAINVVPTEKIPLQDRLVRMGVVPKGQLFVTQTAMYPLADDPYQLFGHRATDLRLGYSSRRNPSVKSIDRHYNYALLSKGDLGWMTSTLSISGSDDNAVNAARLTFERSRFDGLLGINHFEIGDIRSGGSNRGLLIRGGGVDGQLDGQFADDTVPIRGNILPDWEVELYRNGVLIESQLVGDDGRYEFPAVPLVFGENIFELVFYGPFGEEKRERRTHYVGEGMFGLGSFNYELSANQVEKTLLNIDNDLLESDDEGSWVYSAQGSLGVMRRLTLSGRVNSVERDGERSESFNTRMSLAFPIVQLSAGYLWLDNQQDNATGSLRGRVGRVGLNLSYIGFNTRGMEPEEIPNDRQLWRASFGLNASGVVLPFSLSMSQSKTLLTTNSNANLNWTYRHRRVVSLSQAISYSSQDTRERDGLLLHQSFTNIGLAGSIGMWSVRANSSFQLYPDREYSTFDMAAGLRIDRSMAATFEVRHSQDTDTWVYSAGYNWWHDAILITPRLQYDSNERWSGVVSLSTSLATRPHAYKPNIDRRSQSESGGVAARVFWDKNGDGEYGPGDELLEGVTVRAPQGFASADTNHLGVAYLPRLPAYRNTDVVLELATLPDIDLLPSTAPTAVRPRPGHWAKLDYPVIRKLEIEGKVLQRSQEHESMLPVSRVVIALIDAEGNEVNRQRTAFDGYFYFAGIAPGEYQLTAELPADYIVVESPGRIQVIDEFVQGKDFIITRDIHQSVGDESLVPRASRIKPVPTTNQDAVVEHGVPRKSEVTESEWYIQLGAFSVQGNAERLWALLENTQGDILLHFLPTYERNQQTGMVYLFVGVAAGRESAQTICDVLKRRNHACIVKRR